MRLNLSMKKLVVVVILTALIVVPCLPLEAVAAADFVIIYKKQAAYTVFVGISQAKLDAVKAKLANEPDTSLLTWEVFSHHTDKYVKAQIVRDEYPDSRTVSGIVELIRKFPDTPIGLTWNGGIAITHNDYRYAINTYKQYQSDPTAYLRLRKQDPRVDPVNPKGHLRPLLGW